MNVKIGTSGYSFDDWRGTFYPKEIDKGKMLDHYMKQFDTVEINSTYYGIPHPRVFENMARKVPPGFDFMVKVPQTFTHKRGEMEKDRERFLEVLQPLFDTGQLAGLLAQFPYSFKFNPENLDFVARCGGAVAPHQLFAEFRHNGWVNRPMYERLRAEGIGYVSVDEPELPGLLKPDCFATTDIGYVRLHGRNAKEWWDGGALRYDYSYSDDELKTWHDKVRKIVAKVKKVYVYFNNCYQGQAVRDAARFAAMLRGTDN